MVICPKCGSEMMLRTTTKYTYPNGDPRKFYGCSKWPACNGTHGANPDGTPLGIPGNDEVKEARHKAHVAFDP
jgi:ssDNA-binding Zn-finger/Zn-ribbon topoisomerase 1